MGKIIGRQAKGFFFEFGKDSTIVFKEEMKNYVGKVGIVTNLGVYTESARIVFEDGNYFMYPISGVLKNLIKTETVDDFLDSEILKAKKMVKCIKYLKSKRERENENN